MRFSEEFLFLVRFNGYLLIEAKERDQPRVSIWILVKGESFFSLLLFNSGLLRDGGRRLFEWARFIVLGKRVRRGPRYVSERKDWPSVQSLFRINLNAEIQ